MKYLQSISLSLLLSMFLGANANTSDGHYKTTKDVKLFKKNTENAHTGKNRLDESGQFTSNSFNFSSLASVNPEDGTLSFYVPFGKVIGNAFGPDFTLKVSYNPVAVKTGAIEKNKGIFGLGASWAFNLPYYNSANQMLTLSSGQSYQVDTSVGCGQVASLKYHKMNDIQVSWKCDSLSGHPEKVEYSNGNVVYFESDAADTIFFPSKECNRLGQCVYFHYNSDYSLSAVTDDNETNLYQLAWSLDSLTITRTSLPSQSIYTLDFDGSGGELSDIKFFDGNSSIAFGYCNSVECPFANSAKYLQTISMPTGLKLSYLYTKLQLPEAGEATVPAISEIDSVDSSAGTGETNITKYDYNLIDGHNYLGHGSGIPPSSGDDPLFKTKETYQYGTTVTYNPANGVDGLYYKKKYFYDKYHLLIQEVTDLEKVSGGDDIPLLTSKYCYSNQNGYCFSLDKPETADFNELQPTYTLPSKNITKINNYLSSSFAGSKEINITSQYNDAGDLKNKTDPMGITSHATYCQAGDIGCPDSSGFQQYIESKQVIPSGQKDLPSIETYTYENYGDDNVPMISSISNGYIADKKTNNWMKSTYDYFTDKSDLFSYLAMKSNNISLLSGTGMEKSAKIKNLDFNYSYVSKDNYYTKTSSWTPTDGDHELSNVISNSVNYNIFSGNVLSNTNATGVTTQYTYDDYGRPKTVEICDSSEKCYQQSTISYEIYDVNGENAKIVTTPTGFQVKKVYNGYGELISVWSRNSASASWVQILSVAYDAFNHISNTVKYNHPVDKAGNPSSELYKLKTKMDFDLLGRLIQKVSPSEVAEETVYDDVNNRSIVFSVSTAGKLTGITVSVKNDDGLDTDKYIFPNTIFSDLLSNIDSDVTAETPLANDGTLADKLRSKITEAIGDNKYIQHTSKIYDGYNRVISSTNSDGGVTSYTYNNAGYLTDVKLPNMHTIMYGYEPLLNRVSTVSIK